MSIMASHSPLISESVRDSLEDLFQLKNRQKEIAYGDSNGQVTPKPKGQTRVPLCLAQQQLDLRIRNNHIWSAVRQYTVRYPSDSLASCFENNFT